MVCEGFSNWISCILRRSGTKCFTVGVPDHQYNILRIKDNKYNIDNIALLDITNDITDYKKGISNSFNYFLLPPDYYLYNHFNANGKNNNWDGKTLNVASSLYITEEDYKKYLKDSNPGYVIEHFGYSRRMLELMGLKMNNEDATNDDIRSAYLNSGLGKEISPSTLINAINYVRRREGDTLVVNNSDLIVQNNNYRGTPFISMNKGIGIINVNLLNPDPTKHFVELNDKISSNDHFIDTINNLYNSQQAISSNTHIETSLNQVNDTVSEANEENIGESIIKPTPEPSIIFPISANKIIENSYARTPELMKTLRALRSFNTSLMTKGNYKKANELIDKVENANRFQSNDFQLDADDELILAQIRSMAEAYKSKTNLVKYLDDCEALMNTKTFHEQTFKNCINEFYNIIGHTSYAMDDKKSTSIRTATTRKLISRNNYNRFQRIFDYYKKWSNLTTKDIFTEENINIENKKKR